MQRIDGELSKLSTFPLPFLDGNDPRGLGSLHAVIERAAAALVAVNKRGRNGAGDLEEGGWWWVGGGGCLPVDDALSCAPVRSSTDPRLPSSSSLLLLSARLMRR